MSFGLIASIRRSTTVPLCRSNHRQLHHFGKESNWWKAVKPNINTLQVAEKLWQQSHGRSSTR